MPCLVGCLALFTPRLALFLVWLFSDLLQQSFKTVLWPVLGFLFMPLTTLAYAWSIHQAGSIQGGYLILVILAVLFDLGLIGAGARGRRKRDDGG